MSQLITLSNKSLIAIKPEMVAAVVSWTWLSPTLRQALLSFLLNIHTKLPMELAHTTVMELVKSPATKTLLRRTKRTERWVSDQWNKPSNTVQYLSVSPPALQLSSNTSQVSLRKVAVLKLITVFLPSAGVNWLPIITNTSSSRTNGEQHGVIKVSSWSISITLARSFPTLLIQSYEQLISLIAKKSKLILI